MADDLALLRRLKASGISFIANVPHIWGGKDILLSPEDALTFGAGPDEAAGRHYGVAPDVYREWLEAGGMVRCDGRTVKGKRCSNFISGGGYDDPAEWQRVRSAGERCAVHGGPPSRHQDG